MKHEKIAEYKNKAKRHITKALATTALVAAGMAPVANAATEKKAYQAKNSTKLENIAKEPGSKLKVTKKETTEIDNSTLKIGKTYYNPNASIAGEWDTAIKVSYPKPGENELLTVAHGYTPETGSDSGVFKDPTAPNAKAENYFNANDIWDYTVLGPQKQPNLNDPIGNITGISIDTNNQDVAMLKVSPETSPYGIDPNNSYNRIPALPLNKLVYLNEKLPIGEQVEVAGIPYTNNNKRINTTGTLIGQYPINSFDGSGKNGKETFEWVAIKASSPATDPGEDGASGSGAITATGNILAPLSYRISEGYGKNRVYDSATDPESFDRATIKELEHESGINLSPDTVLLGYDVAPKNLGRVLLKGLNTPHIYPESTIGSEVSRRLPITTK